MQGMLFQVEALLQHIARRGDSSAAQRSLEVCACGLPLVASQILKPSSAEMGETRDLRGGGRGESGVAAAFFRVGAAALALEPTAGPLPVPRIQGGGQGGKEHAVESRSVLAELLSSLCEEAINTLEGGNSTMIDWADPMRCVMLKEAAKLWTGEAVSSILTSPSSSHERSSQSGHRHAPVIEIERRLRTCLASSSYEVRAAATKSVDRLLEGLLTRARSDGPAAYVVTAPGSRQPLPPVASSIIIRSASSNTPSRPSGMEEVSALLPSTVSAAMMPSSSLLGSGKAVTHLASLLLTDGLTSELCSRLGIALWGHLSGGRESTVKVQGRALRALSKLQEIEELLGGVSPRLGPARSLSAPAGEVKDEVGREADRIEMSRCLFDAARGDEARAAALQCLGRAFGRSLEHACGGPNGAAGEVDAKSSEEVQLAFYSFSRALGSAVSFLSDVSEMSHPDQSELCRRAAVASLSASGLLKLFDADLSTNASLATAEGSILDQCSLRCRAEKSALSSWLVVLKLLEDEDADVRASAAALAMRSFPRRGHGTACGRMPEPSPPGGLFVEVVLKRVVELLGWAASVGAAGGHGAWGALQALVVDPKEEIPALLQPEVSSHCDIGASCE